MNLKSDRLCKNLKLKNENKANVHFLSNSVFICLNIYPYYGINISEARRKEKM